MINAPLAPVKGRDDTNDLSSRTENRALLRPGETTHTHTTRPTRILITAGAEITATEKSTMDFAATDAPLYFVNVSIDHRTPLGSKPSDISLSRDSLAFPSLVRRAVMA